MIGAANYEPAGVDGWEMRKTPTVCDGTVLRFSREGERQVRGLEVRASRNGVLISGYDFVARHDVSDLIAILEMAQRHARSLRHEGGIV